VSPKLILAVILVAAQHWAPTPPSSHRTAQVVLDKMAFGTVPTGLRIGDSVVWVNRDMFRHSATAPGHFDVDLGPGARRSMRLTKAGNFPFSCKYHPGMKGLLRVSQ
jgi:plastocyanin